MRRLLGGGGRLEGASCVTLTGTPPIVSVPERDEVPLLAVTEKVMALGPVPLPPDVIVIQD
jgi:hypothetical protein